MGMQETIGFPYRNHGLVVLRRSRRRPTSFTCWEVLECPQTSFLCEVHTGHRWLRAQPFGYRDPLLARASSVASN
eukprot:gene17718-biopygen11405